jgi:hypothetical protein
MGKPHIICEICKDDGRCLNNETHKDYENNNEDFFGTDYLDCVDYLETKNNTRGEFIKGYVKKLQEEEKNKEPYVSDFVKWSKEYS